jgi:DNA-binding LacI/PurR family transcriptional regulator
MESSRLKQDIIAETVRSWILQGKYSPGDKLPTDTELATQFNVNRCTIAAGLSKLTEENLIDRAPKRGSVVKSQDNLLRSNAVSLVAPLSCETYTTLISKINEHLQEHDLFPVLMDEKLINQKEEVSKFMHRMVKKSYPYGNLVLGDCFPYEDMNKFPFSLFTTVFLLRYHYFEEFPNAKYALVDYEDMGKQVAQYFANKNVKRIIYPAIPEIIFRGAWSSLQVTLLNHIQKYSNKLGIEVDASLFWRMHSGANINDVLPMAINQSTVATGFFAWSDDVIARTVIPALQSMGYNPMADFAILGNFNTNLAKEHGFDTIDHRVEEIAKIGVDMLTEKISDRKILLPPKLISKR